MWDATSKIKTLSKQNLHPKSSCFLKPWNSSKASSLVMERKKLSHYKKSFENPSVRYYRGNNIMFELYGHGLCYEPIPWSLAIV
jgi:hypothetical protein